MTRSRVRERERIRAIVCKLRPVVAKLRTLAEDATARPSERVHSRALLRRDMLRGIRELEARIDAAASPEHGSPAGCGGSPAL